MKKGGTTVLIAVATVLLCSISMFGQAAQPSSQSGPGAEAQPNSINDKDVEMLRANLRANRKELMARNMNLTADEATKFWPIFDQYRKEAIKPNDERWALIKEYAANYSTMTDAQAQEVHAFIRQLLGKIWNREFADRVRIQYGGSMKPENAKGLLDQPDVDGGLIGGASLKAESFLAIVNAAK